MFSGVRWVASVLLRPCVDGYLSLCGLAAARFDLNWRYMIAHMNEPTRQKGRSTRGLWNTLNQLFDVLPSGAKAFYIWYAVITGALGLLETAALALMLVVITPMVSGAGISIPIVGEIPTGWTVPLLVVMCVIFVLKGVIAVSLHWFATRRFARYELEVGNDLFRAYTRSSWEQRSELSTAEVTRIVDGSMANANLGFIVPLSQIPTNLVSFVSILIVLIVADPMVALLSGLYLGVVALFIMVVLNRRMRLAGLHNRKFGYRVATIMTEMVDALKEITLRGKLDEVGEVVNANRIRATRARANLSFLRVVPKYAMEIALIGGFMLIGGYAYWQGGVSEALFSVALFGVTGFRIIPALNSIQSSLSQAASYEVYAQDVISELTKVEIDEVIRTSHDTEILPENPRVLELANVGFRYPRADRDVLDDINLTIPFGSTLAIVGPSGAGKSTLVDILLGLSQPTRGDMKIDGIRLSTVMNQWRERVGYVPQRVALFDGSIAQNVALTWSTDYDQDLVVAALKSAELEELTIRGRGIRELIGERGSSISGGQQQRIGVARALYSNPLVMVMDEATSSLDTATERRVTESLGHLQGDVTFVTVAHRLATIRDYDCVCYLDEGVIMGSGTFDEVVARVPEFAQQAALAGLL